MARDYGEDGNNDNLNSASSSNPHERGHGHAYEDGISDYDKNRHGPHRGHQAGAFGNLNRHQGAHGPVDRPSEIGNNSGLGQGPTDLKGALNNMGSLSNSPVGKFGQASGKAMKGANGDDGKGMTSGLPDPDKDRDRRQAPDKNLANMNGLANTGSPYEGAGRAAPSIARNLGGRMGKAYSNAAHVTVSGVQNVAKKLHIKLGVKAAAGLTKIIMSTALGGALMFGAYSYYNHRPVLDGTPVCSTQNVGDESYAGTTSDGAASGDWLNSKALKDVIKFFKGKGFSGVAISGIIGSIGRESHGDPHIIQGGGDTDNPKTVTGATGTHGYGLFQISPGSKYGNWSGFKKGASAWNQCEYIWSAYGGAACTAGVRSDPADAKKLQHAKSPAEAAFYWYYMVEDHVGTPSSYDAKSDREAYAQQAYSHFKLSSIKGDDAKLNSLLGSGNESTANQNADTAESMNTNHCKGKDTEPDSANGVAGYAKAMIGWFNYSEGMRTDFAKDGDWKNISKLSQVNKNGHVDCTSFSWLCGRLAGYRMNGNNWPWTTQALSDPSSAGCKEITNKNDVRPGDFGLNGQHGVVIVGKFHGGDTDAVDCGYDHVRHHSLAECYTGAGGWQSVRFFRPVVRR